MTTSDRQLATREFSDQQIRTRVQAARAPGFGLEKATPAQLNMIYLLAKHYDVDPAIDITVYRDRPFFTIDGRIRLMKRHPQYAGYRCRPLPGPEKEAWGYHPDDLVVECTIRTKEWGEISARGKVTPEEMRTKTPTGTHPSEMAEKRAIARASRMAFGQDVPDEDEAGIVLAEREDPVRVAANAAAYDRAFGSDNAATAVTAAGHTLDVASGHEHVVDVSTGEILEEGSELSGKQPTVAGADSPTLMPEPSDIPYAQLSNWSWRRSLEDRAVQLGIVVKTLPNRAKPEEVAAQNTYLMQEIRQVELNEQLAKEQEATV